VMMVENLVYLPGPDGNAFTEVFTRMCFREH
jgi:hypothetical protein